jgi:hypothetical protein
MVSIKEVLGLGKITHIALVLLAIVERIVVILLRFQAPADLFYTCRTLTEAPFYLH